MLNESPSKEFLEGYNYLGPKSRNPYAVGQPWLAEHIDLVICRKVQDWNAGWQQRFYGEPPCPVEPG